MDETNGNTPRYDSLGAELRKQREIRGISLKEIADATKISRRYLEALESDNHDVLPAPVFTRGFVREFARHIGLDAEEMADRYNALVKPESDGSEDEDALSHSQPLPLVRIDRNLVVFALLLLAFCVVVWWVWSNVGVSSDEPVPVAATTTIEPVTATPDIENPPSDEPAAEAPEPETLELRISVREDTWVILQIDGTAATNEVLRAGDVRTYSADDEFRFEVVGNAGGIDLVLNGTPVAPLGASGRVVRNVVLDWKTLEGLQGEANRDDS